ncbi:MAG: hypothetical protein PHU43_06250 [Candidatus Bipolaricaulis sp.]|nr:hypothetical protein [Candidatus Bipolaricaulis sp.]
MANIGTPEARRELLINQYEFLRAEIVQCINLRYLAIVGIFTTVAGAAVALAGTDGLIAVLRDKELLPFFGMAVAFLVNCFGALYVHEQHRNRRACAFNRAIERVLAQDARARGDSVGALSWENFLLSDVARRTDFGFHVARYFGVALPVIVFSMPVVAMGFVAADLLSASAGSSGGSSFPGMWPVVASFAAAVLLFATAVHSAWRVERNAKRKRALTRTRPFGVTRLLLLLCYVGPVGLIAAGASHGEGGPSSLLTPLALALAFLLAVTSFLLFNAIVRWLGDSGPSVDDAKRWLEDPASML